MAKIIAFFNQAGGVAKTSLTMNIGYQLSLLQQRVLLVDLDPQASLTIFMGLESHELGISPLNSVECSGRYILHFSSIWTFI